MDVLKALFPEVCTLEDWLCRADSSGTLKTSLIREEDTQSYKNFVRTTILGVPEPHVQNGTFTLSQNSYQREVVLRVIERLIKRDGPGKNILTLGFNVMSDDSNAQVSTGVSVEYRYPNNNVNRLHFKVWKQLLSRIGDDLMMCLLEKTSIFILLAPTCYLQIAGTPVYNAWPYESGKTFPVGTTEQQSHRKRNSKETWRTKKSVAETASYNLTVPAANNGLDGRARRKRNVSEMSDVSASIAKRHRTAGTVPEHQFSERVHTSQVELYENQMCKDSKRDNDKKEAGSELIDVKDKVNGQRKVGLVSEDLNFGSVARSLKRKRDDIVSEQSEFKRNDLKICKPSGGSNHDGSLEAGPVFQHKAINDVQTNITGTVDMGSLCTETQRHAMQEHRGDANLGEYMNQSLRNDTEFHGETKEVRETEQDRDMLKRFKPYDHLTYLPRTTTLYNRNIREKVPKSATLSTLDSSTTDAAQYLYEKIFKDTPVHSDDPPVEVMVPDPVAVAFSSGVESSSSEKLQQKTNDVNSVDIVNIKVNIPGDQAQSNPVKSDSHINSSDSNIENRAESSFEKSEDRIDNETAVKAHPSFTNSSYDLVKTPLNVLEIESGRAESKSAYIETSADNSGMKRLELLMKRKESILKNRKPSAGSVISGTKTEISHKIEICDRKLHLETSVHERGRNMENMSCSLLKTNFNSGSILCVKDSVTDFRERKEVSITNDLKVRGDKDTLNMEKSVDLEHYRNASENYKNSCEINNKCVSVESGDSMKVKIINTVSVDAADFTSETPGCKLNVDMQVEAGDTNKTITSDEKQKGLINKVPHSNILSHDQAEAKSQGTGNRPNTCGIEKQTDRCTDSDIEIERKQAAKIRIPVIPELLKLLKEFSSRHRKCPYKVLLRHHCSISWQQDRGKASVMKKPVTKATVARLLGDHIHPRKVYLFLRASFLKTIPPQLLGSDHNKNVILKNVSKLVSKGKFEKVCLGQLMAGLKTTGIAWLQHLQCNNMRLHLLAKLVYWIFRDYIFILLKTFFYITETTFIKYRLLYYRQSVWNKLYIQGLAGLLQRKILKPISEDFAEDSLRKGTSLGVCVLRFLPKQGSLRPIMNMGRNMSQQATKKLSINQQLMDLLHILTYMKNETPSLVGAGKFGTDDVYTSWVQYCSRWRDLGRPELYFVKTDIVNCYDTILQEKLYSVLEAVSSQVQEDFVVRKYATVLVARGNLKRTFHRAVSSLAEYEPDFVQVAKEMIDKNRMHDVILVDKVLHQHETKETLMQLLHSHLFNNIIRVGLKYYIQTGGISQGSVLSTLLCSMYYADMEREFFSITEDDLLMRIVDDYLYVTPSRESATKFLNLMLKGIPEYNCHVNVEKVLVNFQYNDETFGQVAYVEGPGVLRQQTLQKEQSFIEWLEWGHPRVLILC